MCGKKSRMVLSFVVVLLALGVAGCENRAASEARVRAIMEKHKAEFLECEKLRAEALAVWRKSADAVIAGDYEAAQRFQPQSDMLTQSYAKCVDENKTKLQTEFDAARLPKEMVDKVREEWWKQNMQDEKTPSKP